ncbi:hypothetical protein CRI88_08710 [Lysinibacillus fusiformis]|uniref:Uncharacterized protein n=1 Tax=Lysinibacillus fusiformis TaxID=28031 RepID=A0A2I0V2B3_9BACI|nr:hypothetical protein CRI88_08710 [Lysinibacillus fusiformis]
MPFFIVLKNKIIHRIDVKGENGFPWQATCFPVGEPLRVRTLAHGSLLAFQSIKIFLFSKVFK